jgi:hypothetical protein
MKQCGNDEIGVFATCGVGDQLVDMTEKVLEHLGTTESSRGRRQLRRRVVSRRILTSAQRMELSRWRRKRGIHRRTVSQTDYQLDALEVRGYLDPDRRGDRADECDAIEMFLADSLLKG